ncbi:MAG: hypothetical protein KGZ74_07890 [Chitinophagaceae bacterium]|nr:hypothetical protein [Chitinophagaceae bacterium]
MEMMKHKWWLRATGIILFLLLLGPVQAQPPLAWCTVKNGHMYVSVGKTIPADQLKEFIAKYNLFELDLVNVLQTNKTDTLKKAGWTVVKNNSELLILSRTLKSYDQLQNPVDYMIMSHLKNPDDPPFAGREAVYGVNRFKDKYDFAVQDSLVVFYLRGYRNASNVYLAGTFNKWKTDALRMKKVDSGWIATVPLPPGKHYYKFIADDQWMVDKDNALIENDGMGNDNSVYYKTNQYFSMKGYTHLKKLFVAGSFNDWDASEIELTKTNDGWSIPIYLADGTHTYRFYSMGAWFADPGNPVQLPNEYHSVNSVKRIGEAHLFYLKGYRNAKKVMLIGSFNKWRNYELQMQKVDSGWILPYVVGKGNHEYLFEVDGKKIKDPSDVSVGENSVLVTGADYVFRLKGYAQAKEVFIAGEFNQWSPHSFAMQREGDEWVIKMHVGVGKHLYKFIVDGQWIKDPGNKHWEDDGTGNQNSVIWVSKW